MEIDKNHPSFLIEHLLAFALKNSIICKSDIIYIRNRLIEILNIDEPYPSLPDHDSMDVPETATPILEDILDYASQNGIIQENTLAYRDLLDTQIMGVLMPRPSEIINRFNALNHTEGIIDATRDFYRMCRKCDYIRVDRIARNIEWQYQTDFGCLEITINLTKPEIDPKEIALLRNAPQTGYPKCLLCLENVGYAGRINYPARQTLRTLPININAEQWHFQYSPYVYYNHHCIVFSHEHIPMKISKETFIRLLDFLEQFPHYFIGSNADLPIVGGSIINHDHFQGGYHIMPMEKAETEYEVKASNYPEIDLSVIKWPMSALKLRCATKPPLIDLSLHLLNEWRNYSDPSADIIAWSKTEAGHLIPHNTITPIARKTQNDYFELDLIFRNNRTNAEHPMGIFHPHQELHHIKKENIGLIEAMGLFILPGRLQSELSAIKDILTGKTPFDSSQPLPEEHHLNKHHDWIKQLYSAHGNLLDSDSAQEIIRNAVSKKCLDALHHAGVFKATAPGRNAFNRFLKTVGIELV